MTATIIAQWQYIWTIRYEYSSTALYLLCTISLPHFSKFVSNW